MSESNNSKPIAEIIDEEKNKLIDLHPEAADQIAAYVEGVSHLINTKNLDDICLELERAQKYKLDGLPTKVREQVTKIRKEVREKIEIGEIVLGKVPVKSNKKTESIPGSIEEAVILAGTDA